MKRQPHSVNLFSIHNFPANVNVSSNELFIQSIECWTNKKTSVEIEGKNPWNSRTKPVWKSSLIKYEFDTVEF